MTGDFYSNFFEKVNSSILEHPQGKPLALYTGLAGQVLYYSEYLKKFDNHDNRSNFKYLVETLFEALNTQNYDSSFCSGLSGISFLMRHLAAQDLLEGFDYEEFLEQVDIYFVETISKEVDSVDQIDFLHGYLGIANYLLEFATNIKIVTNIAHYEVITSQIISHLEKVRLDEDNTELINFGLSHGLASYIEYFIKLFRQTGFPQIRDYLRKIVTIYRYFYREDTQSCFPSQGYSIHNANYDVNLGWCYGDQTISYCLYKAGLFLEDNDIIDFSKNIVKKWILKNSVSSAFINPVYDNMFCHGLAGIAYVSKKWFVITGEEKLMENYKIFMNKIFSSEQLYSKFDNLTEVYAENFWLLDGSSGLGLVLLDSIEDNQSGASWDNFFLLN